MPATDLDYSTLDGPLAGLTDARRWYVGFSGGVDSTVLLHLLQRWCRSHAEAPPLTAIHINHGLQAQADDWQLHCEWVCKMLQVPCVSLPAAVEVGDHGLEAAARDARYREFESILEAGDILLLGHHLDDQVETFFLRLLRGAGVQGLSAMPASRALGLARLARPLLHLSREQLEGYAIAQGLQYVEDPSNSNVNLDRNFLRQQLLPQLAQRWPGYRQTVARASGHMAGTVQALEQFLPSPDTVVNGMGDPGLSLGELVDVPPEAAGLSLRNWLQRGGYQAPDFSALQEFLRQLRESGPDASPRLQCSAYTLQRYREAVYLLPEPQSFLPPLPLSLEVGEVYEIEGLGRVGLEPTDGSGLLVEPGELLSLCWRRGGERCRPVGRGGASSLKKLLQEAGVPPWWRERVPLLYLEGELLAVGGLRPCESSRWSAGGEGDQTLWQLSWERNEGTPFD